jgi:ribosome-associated translation inhibitor RaiA
MGMTMATQEGDRMPFPASIPRPDKAASARGSSGRVTAHVRVIGLEIDEPTRAYIQRKLGRKLAKFATSLERVSVRVMDVNGPRGGVDQLCLIKVVLSGLPSVVVERRRPAVQAAIDTAIRAAEHAVQRTLGRRRLKPLHRRRQGEGRLRGGGR